jgi:hypothetical protein
MTQIPPETDPFLDLVRGLKEALATPDPAKAEMYRNEIALVEDHIDRLVVLVP